MSQKKKIRKKEKPYRYFAREFTTTPSNSRTNTCRTHGMNMYTCVETYCS